MKEINNVEEIQSISFDILKHVKYVCDSNNLKYYLAFGTLLGAVRHGGFIPWDDDVDIWMPREDIIKLISILEKDSSCYKVVSSYNMKNFTAPLPKVIDNRTILHQEYSFIEKVELGIYIDVFPLEGAGDTIKEANRLYARMHKYYKRWRRADTKMFPANQNKVISFLKWVKNSPNKVFGIDHWLKRIDDVASEHSFYRDKYVGVLTNFQDKPKGNVFPKDIIGDGTNLKFNGIDFRVPKDYKTVLEAQYGDYMTLPPVEQRVSHHKYKAMWIGDQL